MKVLRTNLGVNISDPIMRRGTRDRHANLRTLMERVDDKNLTKRKYRTKLDEFEERKRPKRRCMEELEFFQGRGCNFFRRVIGTLWKVIV